MYSIRLSLRAAAAARLIILVSSVGGGLGACATSFAAIGGGDVAPPDFRGEVVYEVTKRVLRARADDPMPRFAFDGVFRGRPGDFAGAVRALADDHPYGSPAARAFVEARLLRVLSGQSAADPAWWVSVRDGIAESLRRLLAGTFARTRRSNLVVALQSKLNLFMIADLPYLSHQYLGSYAEGLAEPWLTQSAHATGSARADVIARLRETDTPAPLLALARAYHSGWARGEIDLRRVLRATIGDVAGTDRTSARRAYSRLNAQDPVAAARLRFAAAVVLDEVLTDLHERHRGGDAEVRRALAHVQAHPLTARTPEHEVIVDRVSTAIRTGDGVTTLADVGLACAWNLRY